MSSFTQSLIIRAVSTPDQGWRRMLPPGFHRPEWEVIGGFAYAVGDLARPISMIHVPDGFKFDGASVPLLFRVLVPMAHPDYIQAAALHDFMLDQGAPRAICDAVFLEALGVLGMPPFWARMMYAAVRFGSAKAWVAARFRGLRHAV